jgi:hypothetical protein
MIRCLIFANQGMFGWFRRRAAKPGELCMLEGERLELLWLIGPSHNIQVARELGAGLVVK